MMKINNFEYVILRFIDYGGLIFIQLIRFKLQILTIIIKILKFKNLNNNLAKSMKCSLFKHIKNNLFETVQSVWMSAYSNCVFTASLTLINDKWSNNYNWQNFIFSNSLTNKRKYYFCCEKQTQNRLIQICVKCFSPSKPSVWKHHWNKCIFSSVWFSYFCPYRCTILMIHSSWCF